MYITNFQHFLDADGNIPTSIPVEALRLAYFQTFLIEEATMYDYDAEPTIKCFNQGCTGKVVTWVEQDSENVVWICIKCKTEGRISNWQNTKWDNTNR